MSRILVVFGQWMMNMKSWNKTLKWIDRKEKEGRQTICQLLRSCCHFSCHYFSRRQLHSNFTDETDGSSSLSFSFSCFPCLDEESVKWMTTLQECKTFFCPVDVSSSLFSRDCGHLWSYGMDGNSRAKYTTEIKTIELVWMWDFSNSISHFHFRFNWIKECQTNNYFSIKWYFVLKFPSNPYIFLD